MRLVSFSIDGSRTVRSGIETEDGIADVQSVGAVAGLSETVLPLLTSTRAILALAPGELRTLESTAASSASELRLANNLWTGGKAIDTFGPCGPALVTLDEIGDIQALPVRTRVNGRTVQDGNTAEMIFSVAEIIAFLSQIMTLESGDIIATGTPAGVGNSRIPKLFLRAA